MSKLRIVKGNEFTTLINITAISPSGDAVVWSLTDSTNIEVSAVSKTKKVLLSHTIVSKNELTAVWKGNLPVATYGIEVKGTYNGRAWRLMDEAALDIVFSNEEACIPEDSIVDGGYLLDTDFHLVGGGTSAQADWAEDDPSKSGYIKNKPNLAAVATSGAYSDLQGLPTIPTRVGQLTNDAGYVTSSTLSGYATKSEMTEAEVAIGQLSDKVDGIDESIEGLEESVASLESGKADVSHTHPHTSITDWDAATASFLTTTTAAATYLSKTDAAATYATKASVPTKTSDLTNDSGFITTASLSGYATEEWVQDAWDAYDQEYHMTTAYTTATAAASAASAADTKATNAATAASTADTKATNAQTSANAAQTRADNAYTLANTANTTANAALPRAEVWSGTQAQYDALTAEQKAAVIAFIEEE